MFKSANCGHTHATIYEAKVCIGLIRPEPAKVYSPPPVPYKDQPGTMSSKQERLLKRFGAEPFHLSDANGRRLSMNQASKLIDDFKAGRISMDPTPRDILAPDPRLEFARQMLDMVPDGYYAVTPDASVPLTFLRISTPKSGQFMGARKVQTQHSDDLVNRAVLWPSGRWSQYPGFDVDKVLLIVTDPQGAAIRYGQELHYCCRCRKALTDERSRHYGIGPECEKHRPDIITRVDEEQLLSQA